LGEEVLVHASVVDGDTLMVRGISIRLWGATPLSLANFAEANMVTNIVGVSSRQQPKHLRCVKAVNCNPINPDRNGRTVATRPVDGADPGEWPVRSGLGWICRKIPVAGMAQLSTRLSKPGGGFWKGVT